MTQTASRNRKACKAAGPEGAAMALIMAAAAWLRLRGVDFGLPALHDPDEPVFVMTAFEMLRDRTLNPGWFGHPGTTTIVCLAAIMYAVGAFGIATGRFADADAFASAVYADPGIVFLPGRLLIVLCGAASVWLTYRLGKRVGGPVCGVAAAGFLAVNALHIEYSQIIRTDVMASVLMLGATISAVRILERGRLKDYVAAGVLVGLACATKWPAVLIAFNPAFAALWRFGKGERGWRNPLALAMSAPAALLAASPYLVLDFPTVLANLGNEARPFHPGATGEGFLSNLAWYAVNPLGTSFGWIGLIAGTAGVVLFARRRPSAALAVLPGPTAFLLAICGQSLIWERWVVPLLPFLALGLGWVLRECWLRTQHAARWSAALPVAAGLAVAAPMLVQSRASAIERDNDTRQLASAWVRENIPAGATILLEHAGIDLLGGKWNVKFPLGAAGCIDARAALSGRIRFSEAEARQAGRPALDIGYLAPATTSTCTADYAIISRYSLYAADPVRFGAQIAQYRAILKGAQRKASFFPRKGRTGGPPIVILRLPRP